MSYKRRNFYKQSSSIKPYYNQTNYNEGNNKGDDKLNEKQVLINKMKSLLILKENSRTRLEELFNEFNTDFELNINQLKENARKKFDDYISHPKTKLRNNNDEVNDALKSLEKELKEILKVNTSNIEVKLQNLRAMITVTVNYVNKNLYETKAQFEKVYLTGNVEGDKKLQFDDLAEPLVIGFGIYGGGLGAILGIGIAQGIGESIGAGLFLGEALGFAGVGIGLIIGLVGFGIYNLYKATHKEEDLVELATKGKNKFFQNINNYYYKVKAELDKYKEEVITELIDYIEKQVAKFQTAMDEMDKPKNNQMSQYNYYYNSYNYNIINKNKK